MKKFLILVLMLALVLLLPVMALAEGAGMDGSSFFTWDSIGTFTGAVALVVFLVQMLKLPLDRVWHIPTQYIVYVMSLGVLLLAQMFVPSLGGLTWDGALLCVFNAALVALAAMSTYEIAIGNVEMRKVYTQLVQDGVDLGAVAEEEPDKEPGETTASGE